MRRDVPPVRAIIRDQTLSIYEKMVFLVLWDHKDAWKQCFPSQSTIAEEARISERQVRRALQTLTERGFIRIREMGGGRRATLYQLPDEIHLIEPDDEQKDEPKRAVPIWYENKPEIEDLEDPGNEKSQTQRAVKSLADSVDSTENVDSLSYLNNVNKNTDYESTQGGLTVHGGWTDSPPKIDPPCKEDTFVSSSRPYKQQQSTEPKESSLEQKLGHNIANDIASDKGSCTVKEQSDIAFKGLNLASLSPKEEEKPLLTDSELQEILDLRRLKR